jgi:ATP-dependent DNA ligase
MLMRSAKRLPSGGALRDGCVYEPKWDGYRGLV